VASIRRVTFEFRRELESRDWTDLGFCEDVDILGRWLLPNTGIRDDFGTGLARGKEARALLLLDRLSRVVAVEPDNLDNRPENIDLSEWGFIGSGVTGALLL